MPPVTSAPTAPSAPAAAPAAAPKAAPRASAPAQAAPKATPPKPAAQRPPPGPPAEKAQDDWMAEESLELDGLDDSQKPPRQAPKAKKEDPAPEPEGEATTPKEKTPEEEVGEAEPEEPAEEVRATGPEALRDAYQKSQRKIREELNPKISKLEARVKELESSGAEPSAMVSQLKTITEENQKLRAKLSENDYRQHPDYLKQQAVFEKQFTRARSDLKNIEVHTEDGGTRTVTDDDIIALANQPYGKDRAMAKEMFGDAADDVLAHTRKIREIAEEQSNWVEDNRKNAGKAAQEREASRMADHIQRSKTFADANSALAERYPQWFQPKEGDKEGNARLDAGIALTNLMFGKNTPEQIRLLPKQFRDEIETNGKLSPESGIRLHALIRSKAMNHDRLAGWMKQLRAELKEAKTALSQFEASEPGGGSTRRPGGGSGQSSGDDYEQELDNLSRKGA